MTYTQIAQATTDADISAERRSATTAAGEPPTMTSVTERDTATDAGPQLIDGYHILFSAAAALPLRPATITRRLIDAIRVVGATLHLPPARRPYPGRQNYIEHARMAREMCRL